jgi:hypothetical protein
MAMRNEKTRRTDNKKLDAMMMTMSMDSLNKFHDPQSYS